MQKTGERMVFQGYQFLYTSQAMHKRNFFLGGHTSLSGGGGGTRPKSVEYLSIGLGVHDILQVISAKNN